MKRYIFFVFLRSSFDPSVTNWCFVENETKCGTFYFMISHKQDSPPNFMQKDCNYCKIFLRNRDSQTLQIIWYNIQWINNKRPSVSQLRTTLTEVRRRLKTICAFKASGNSRCGDVLTHFKIYIYMYIYTQINFQNEEPRFQQKLSYKKMGRIKRINNYVVWKTHIRSNNECAAESYM